MSAAAAFDALYLISSSDASIGVSSSEIQVLDYLACLMSVYDGEPVESWGYGFSVTDLGAPFSTVLEEALQQCERAGWIDRLDRVYRPQPAGTKELAFQRTLAPNVSRTRYLNASASASLTMTLPSIADALNQEPGLKRALAYLRRKRLLDETSLTLVTEQFEGLRSAVGDGTARDSLMVPTAVWLSYLATQPEGSVGGNR